MALRCLSVQPISSPRSCSQMMFVMHCQAARGGATAFQNLERCRWIFCTNRKLQIPGSRQWRNGNTKQFSFSFEGAKIMSPDKNEGDDLEGFMRHVGLCNRGNNKKPDFLPFFVEGTAVGYIHPWFVSYLVDYPNVFTIHEETSADNNMEMPPTQKNFVTLHHNLRDKEEKTKAVGKALETLRQRGIIPGWRNEMYPVISSFGTPPLFSMERSAVPFFGIKAYGVHMNGYVNEGDRKCLWIAKRSKTKQTFPGLLDHLVAGGQPVGLTCKRNLIKECEEEAGIPETIAQRAISVGAVSYEDINGYEYKRDVLFCYDLELPKDFQPYNKDGEVESFILLPIAKVKDIIWNTRSFKPNCVLVILDFLFRHGFIEPERKGYLQLLQSLRSGECL